MIGLSGFRDVSPWNTIAKWWSLIVLVALAAQLGKIYFEDSEGAVDGFRAGTEARP